MDNRISKVTEARFLSWYIRELRETPYVTPGINIARILATNSIVLDFCNSHGCEWRLKDAPSDRRCNAINATPVENADLRCSCFRRREQAIIPTRDEGPVHNFVLSSIPSAAVLLAPKEARRCVPRLHPPARLPFGTMPRIVSLDHVKILGLQLVPALSDTRYWNLPQPKALRR